MTFLWPSLTNLRFRAWHVHVQSSMPLPWLALKGDALTEALSGALSGGTTRGKLTIAAGALTGINKRFRTKNML